MSEPSEIDESMQESDDAESSDYMDVVEEEIDQPSPLHGRTFDRLKDIKGKCPIFNGNPDESYKNWLIDIEAYLEPYNLTNIDQGKAANMGIKGKAREFMQRLDFKHI